MGCVRRRRNRWVVDFRDTAGARHWETFKRRKDADAALAARVEQLRRGSYRPPAEVPTFAVVARQWLASKADRRPSTVAGWQTHLDLHLVPALGALRLNEIHVGDMERLRAERRTAGLSAPMVNKILTTARAVFAYAQQHELIERNPAAQVERCRRDATELVPGASAGRAAGEAVGPDEVLGQDEARRLIAAAAPGFDRTFLLTALLTGARVGELTGLTWGNVDLAAGTVRIDRSISWGRLRGSTGPSTPRFFAPKTATSRRTIPIPAELTTALKRWKLACPPSTLELVFPDADGRPRHRSAITRGTLDPALKRAKLRHVTLHSLRHSYASALLAAGHPVTEVSSLLGHSSPGVTLKVYAHWLEAERNTNPAGGLARAVLFSGD